MTMIQNRGQTKPSLQQQFLYQVWLFKVSTNNKRTLTTSCATQITSQHIGFEKLLKTVGGLKNFDQERRFKIGTSMKGCFLHSSATGHSITFHNDYWNINLSGEFTHYFKNAVFSLRVY